MNKTVNINLAGIFFHIDEDAYLKLHTYLETIKRSIKDPNGRQEIIRDIEARIAELFQEKMQGVRQVVGLEHVEEVILILGQPEDYILDEELFEDETEHENTKEVPKKLFRDKDNAYIAGVSSGLGHFFGMDPVWLRLLWVVLTVVSGGTFAFVYLAFWIFVPEAKTTADKLYMRGEPVNISNIEKKVKEGFDSVADKVKGINYEKYGSKAKNGASTFFESFGSLIMFCLKIIAKFIGIILVLMAASALICLFFALFSIGTFGVIEAPWMDYVELSNIGAPLWLVSIFVFFSIAIPFVFLLILGLKILVNNLKSIGKPAKLVLLGLWLISIFALGFLGIRQAAEHAFDGEVFSSENIPIQKNDTLYVEMRRNPAYGESLTRNSGFKIKHDEAGNKILFSRDVRLRIASTKDSLAQLEIVKSAEGSSFQNATQTANTIFYTFDYKDNKLSLDGYFTTPAENNFRDQEVDITLYLPEGSILFAGEKTHDFHEYDDILARSQEGHFLKIKKDSAECMDCGSTNSTDIESSNKVENENNDEKIDVRIDENGIEINQKP